jgi:hypothetical protein
LAGRELPCLLSETVTGGTLKLIVIAQQGMVDIDSETEQISFGLIEGMYQGGKPGYGLQVGDEAKRPAIEALCFAITEAVKTYRQAIA